MSSLPTYLHPSIVINPPSASIHADTSSPADSSDPPDTSVFEGSGPSAMLTSPMRRGHRHRRSQAISGDFDFLSQINQNPLFPPPGPGSPTKQSFYGSPSSPTPSHVRSHSRSQSALLGSTVPSLRPRPMSCYAPSKPIYTSSQLDGSPKLLASSTHSSSESANAVSAESIAAEPKQKVSARSKTMDLPPQTIEAMTRNFDLDINSTVETVSGTGASNAGWFIFPPSAVSQSPRKGIEHIGTSQPVTPKLSLSSFHPPQPQMSQEMGSGSTPASSHFALGSLNGSPYYYSSPRNLRSPFHKKAVSVSYNEVPDPIIDLNDILVAAASGSGPQPNSALNSTSTPVSPARGLRSSHSAFLHRRTELLPPTLESLLQSPFARNYGGITSGVTHNANLYPEQAIEEEEDTDFEEEKQVNSTPNINQQSTELVEDILVPDDAKTYVDGVEIVGVHVDDDDDDDDDETDDHENVALVVSQDSLQPPRGLSSRRSDEFDNLYTTLANSSSTSLPNSKPPPIEKTFSNTSNASLNSKRSQARATRYQSFYDQSFKISSALKLNYSSESLSHSSSLSSLRNKYTQQQLIPQNSLQSLLANSKSLSPTQPPISIGHHSRDASSSQTSLNSESSFTTLTPIIYQNGSFGGTTGSPAVNAQTTTSNIIPVPQIQFQPRLSLPRINEYRRATKSKTNLNNNPTMLNTTTSFNSEGASDSPSSSTHSTTLVPQGSISPSISVTSPSITITSYSSTPKQQQNNSFQSSMKPLPLNGSETALGQKQPSPISVVSENSAMSQSTSYQSIDTSSKASLASLPTISPVRNVSPTHRKVVDVTNLPRYNPSHTANSLSGGFNTRRFLKLSMESGTVATRTTSRSSLGERSKRKQFIDWLKRK